MPGPDPAPNGRHSSMLDPEDLVTTLRSPADEIPLLSAAGLLPRLAERTDRLALLARVAIADPVIRVWAFEKLLKQNVILEVETFERALQLVPQSAFLRRSMVDALIKMFRFDLVGKILAIEEQLAPQEALTNQEFLRARYQNDYPAQIRSCEKLYLLTGDLSHINDASEIARSRLGFREAMGPYLRQIFVQAQPVYLTALAVLRMLEREDARAEFLRFGELIRPLPSMKLPVAYYWAQKLYWDKDYKACQDFIKKSNVLKVTGNQTGIFHNMLAMCEEGRGRYKYASEYYQKQNDMQKKFNIEAGRFISDLEERANWQLGSITEDENDKYYIMTGFPRSGTTLLENALAAHPDVETCEETGSLIGSIHTAYKSPIPNDPNMTRINLRAMVHRNLYYLNINRHVHKKDASVVIDKTPIIGANIKYMEKIFQNKKYIFSIRHPYDVVLSNYKQYYHQNIAMAAFNDIDTACELYDYVMKSWFEVFPGETNRVCYVKYDDLVENFQGELEKVLGFLGVDWADDVLKFAEKARNRAVRTPSYANVRKGLTIGVQSSWRNYEFIFDDKCRKLLDPWVERFGYDVGC